MTANQRTWKELQPDVSAAHREFVTKLREIRECSPRTQADIARRANQEPTTLSNHLNAGRIPEETLLRDFYMAVAKDAADAGHGPLPYSLDELQELRLQARKKHCACCAVGYPASAAQPESPVQQPASPSVTRPDPELARARRLRRRSRRREFSVPREPVGVARAPPQRAP
ncbi:hypothetical protein, partial [Streptomyces sp. NPDC002530]